MSDGKTPIAFLSYVHEDDEYEGGRLTQFRERLEGEIPLPNGRSKLLHLPRSHRPEVG